MRLLGLLLFLCIGSAIAGIPPIPPIPPAALLNQANIWGGDQTQTQCVASSTAGSITINSGCSSSIWAAPLSATQTASFSASISGTSLTISATGFSGTVQIGATLSDGGVHVGSYVTIVSQTSGTTGSSGVYVISSSQGTVSSESMTTNPTYNISVPSCVTPTYAGCGDSGLIIFSQPSGGGVAPAWASGLQVNTVGASVLTGANTVSMITWVYDDSSGTPTIRVGGMTCAVLAGNNGLEYTSSASFAGCSGSLSQLEDNWFGTPASNNGVITNSTTTGSSTTLVWEAFNTWFKSAMGSTAGEMPYYDSTSGWIQGSGVLLDSSADVVVQASNSTSTTATTGFLWIPTVAGAPTGTPSSAATYANQAPFQLDTSDQRFYVYNGSAWNDMTQHCTQWSGNTAGTTVAAGATDYATVTGSEAPTATEAIAETLVSVGSGTVSNLYVSASAAPGSTYNDAITLRVNGGNATLTCSIINSTTTCHDTTHSSAVNTAGFPVDLKIVSSSSSATAAYYSYGMTFCYN